MVYALGADLLVALHVAYVAFVVVGQLLIVVGWMLAWQWIRNLWFRLAHLGAIGLVAVEAAFQIPCPLTVWEHRLRRLAGQHAGDVSFVGRLLRDLVFVDLPESTLRLLHIAFGLLVLATLLFVRPHLPSRHSSVNDPAALQ